MTCYSPKSKVIRCVTSTGAALHCTAEKHRRSGERTSTIMGSWNCLVVLLLALPSALSMAYKEPGSLLYPYGPAHNDLFTDIEDDGGTDEIFLTHSFTFFEEIHRRLYVNNNGAISFNTPVTEYTPDAFPIPDLYMICPYWGDVDNECGGLIYYRQTTDEELLSRLSDDINKMSKMKYFHAEWAFIATWDAVAYHGTESNKTNTFQVILAADGLYSTVMFIYHDIQWTTGTASGGDPKTGLGGTPAQAGFNTGNEYFNIPFSRTEHIINIKSSSNVGVPGVWLFRVDKFVALGGCQYKRSFLSHGQTVWIDEGCTTHCTCRHSGEVLCIDKKCNEGFVCVPSDQYYLCQIDEENC
ncbi:alpha-tectorin-like [Phyllobates terribilis]|uniref:alpha-tectorin-like n=1 Tax=Phyllobates terribilis TaxID=111132 RepID=UPI003CCA774A